MDKGSKYDEEKKRVEENDRNKKEDWDEEGTT
jgi:hypothetical protein